MNTEREKEDMHYSEQWQGKGRWAEETGAKNDSEKILSELWFPGLGLLNSFPTKFHKNINKDWNT